MPKGVGVERDEPVSEDAAGCPEDPAAAVAVRDHAAIPQRWWEKEGDSLCKPLIPAGWYRARLSGFLP